jgi:hypothetical protein
VGHEPRHFVPQRCTLQSTTEHMEQLLSPVKSRDRAFQPYQRNSITFVIVARQAATRRPPVIMSVLINTTSSSFRSDVSCAQFFPPLTLPQYLTQQPSTTLTSTLCANSLLQRPLLTAFYKLNLSPRILLRHQIEYHFSLVHSSFHRDQEMSML